MRLCGLLFLLIFLPIPGLAETTPTEAAAIAAASNDHAAYTLPPERLAKAEAIGRIRVALTFGDPIWQIASLILLLQSGIARRMRNVAVKLSPNRWAQGFCFFLLFVLAMTLLTLPMDIYAQHVRLSYGLSVQSWVSWIGDQAKSFALLYVFGGLGTMLLFFLIRKSPRGWWLWLWFPAVVFTVVTIFATPYVIDPLFNKFEPLAASNPALVAQLERVVTRGKGIEIPPERMFLMKASDKVTTLNAYVTGFGASKRVVVWDTSIAKGTPDEILFIFGHEMGHYVLGHIVRGMVFGFAFMLILFFLGFHLAQFLLGRFGRRWGVADQRDWGALVVYVLVVSVLGFVSQPIQSAFSRGMEHDADVYGEEVIHGIVDDPQAAGQATFQILGENSLDDPNPSAFVEWWAGSHPPIWYRAAFAKHYDPWAPHAQPKYFAKP